MENENHAKSTKLLIAAVGVLFIALAGLAFYTYNLHSVVMAQQSPQLSGDIKQLPKDAQASSRQQNKQSPFIGSDLFADDFWSRDSWNPYEEMRRMQEEMNQIFGNAFSRFQLSPQYGGLFESSTFSPSIDVKDEGDHYEVVVDLPGAEQSTVDVSPLDQGLRISAKTESEAEEKKDQEQAQILRRERYFGSFERIVPLPPDALPKKMTSNMENGVLVVVIPKDYA